MTPSISFASVVSLFGSLGVLASLLLVGVLAWAITRTRSMHIVMYRLWRLASGGAEIQDEKIRAYFQDQHALMSFRFVTGLVLHRIRDVHALIDWSEQRQIDIEQMGRAGEYFDPNLKTVDTGRFPRKGRLIRMLIAAVVSWLLMLLTGLMLALYFDEALVSFTATGSHFTMKAGSARRVPFWSDTFRITDCASPGPAGRAGFSAKEQAVLCESFRNPDAQRQIAENISAQRTGLAMLLFALFVATVINTRAVQHVQFAKKLADNLKIRPERRTRSRT
jgi:hypothetical protein